MWKSDHPWALILAGGDGSRLRSLTLGRDGTPVPKQFWCFDGSRSLLDRTIERIEHIVPRERMVIVVTEAHRAHFDGLLWSHPRENVVVQPQNRGTAPGILLPLLHILARDPHATILVVPSDHQVEAESVLIHSAHHALTGAMSMDDRIILLGMPAEGPAHDLGWILPGATLQGAVRAVLGFMEKPDPRTARLLQSQGGLWSSFIMAASGRAFMRIFDRVTPWLAHQFVRTAQRQNPEPDDLTFLYRSIPPCDFSKFVLQRSWQSLGVVPVPPCGWRDVGTTDRSLRPEVSSLRRWGWTEGRDHASG